MPSGQVEVEVEVEVGVSVVVVVGVGVSVEIEVEGARPVDAAPPLLACAHPARASATSVLTPLRA
jgi:hypothetical protein